MPVLYYILEGIGIVLVSGILPFFIGRRRKRKTYQCKWCGQRIPNGLYVENVPNSLYIEHVLKNHQY